MDLPQDIESCHLLIRDLLTLVDRQQAQLKQNQEALESLVVMEEHFRLLTARVKELESQLNQNSRNSNRPPSSDGFRKGPAMPRNKGGKSGGQDGHGGHTLKMVENADEVISHTPSACVFCGKMHYQEPLVLRGRRQVLDIPVPRVIATEHQVFDWLCCGCGQENRGKFPGEVKAPVQYGLRLKTLSVLLNNTYCLSLEKAGQLLHDLFGIRINDSTQQSNNELAFECLAVEEQYIQNQLLHSPVVHFDETGIRFNAHRYWLHVASNKHFTHLFAHTKRGFDAHQDGCSILPSFRGWAMHDCWSTYFRFDQTSHAVCGAHLLRELKGLEENGSNWAKDFHKFLLDLYEKTGQGKSQVGQREQLNTLLQYAQLLEKAEAEEPPPQKGPRGKPKQTKGRNLLDRLVKHQQAVLAFAWHTEVPFTNNQAERDIRPTKTKNKISGSFRTEAGAHIYARIQSFISTVRKLQLNPFNELCTVLSGGTPAYRIETT
jgi:transposase